jgi:hypothetical protein
MFWTNLIGPYKSSRVGKVGGKVRKGYVQVLSIGEIRISDGTKKIALMRC